MHSAGGAASPDSHREIDARPTLTCSASAPWSRCAAMRHCRRSPVARVGSGRVRANHRVGAVVCSGSFLLGTLRRLPVADSDRHSPARLHRPTCGFRRLFGRLLDDHAAQHHCPGHIGPAGVNHDVSLPIGEDGVDQRAAAPAVSSEHPSAICHGELDMARQGAARCACDADGCLDGGPGDPERKAPGPVDADRRRRCGRHAQDDLLSVRTTFHAPADDDDPSSTRDRRSDPHRRSRHVSCSDANNGRDEQAQYPPERESEHQTMSDALQWLVDGAVTSHRPSVPASGGTTARCV